MSDAQTLELIEVPISEIARPNHSLILADASFMTTLKQVEGTVAAIKITDAQSAQQAADLLTRLTKAGSALEKQRQALKAPYLTLMTQIDAAAKGAANRIDSAKRTLSKLQTDFAIEQRRIAEEQERLRQAELRRLEEQRQAEEKAAKEKADKIAADLKAQQEAAAKVAEAARLAGLPVTPVLVIEDWGDDLPAAPIQKTAIELEIERVKFAPAPVVAKPSGVRIITTLFPFVENVALLPDMFVDRIPKIAAIRSTFCAGFKPGDPLPVLSGCRFEIQTSTQSTGKAQF